MLALLVPGMLLSTAISQPCSRRELDVARAGREIYLDPSIATRARVTKQLVEDVVAPLESPDAFATLELKLCARDTTAAADELGDAVTLSEAYRALAKEYDRLHGQLRDDASPVVRDGIEFGRSLATERAATLARVSVPDSLPRLSMLVGSATCHENEEAARDLISRISSPRLSRLERLDAVLGLPADTNRCRLDSSAPSVGVLARAWAVDVITSGSDPREWDTVEFTHLVLAARAQSASGTPNLDLLGKLHCIGFRRAWRLLYPPTVRTMFPELPPSPGVIGYSGDQRFFHFPYEGNLYRSEWEATTPPQDSVLASWLVRRARFADEQWIATDDAAPHPDLKALEKALPQPTRESGR